MKTILGIEDEKYNVKSYDDRRKRVHRLIVSYQDAQGHEYRKRFEFPASYTAKQMQDARLSIPKEI